MNKKERSSWFATIGIVLFLFAGIFLAWYLSVGEIVITNSRGDVERAHMLSCESEMVSYPFFTYDKAEGRLLKIDAIFENDKLARISLYYKLDYNDASQIQESEVNNHIAMNNAFKEDGLVVDSFGANYSKFFDGLQLSLYAESKDLNGVKEKYFLLDGLSGNYWLDEVKQQMNKMGFDCIEKK